MPETIDLRKVKKGGGPPAPLETKFLTGPATPQQEFSPPHHTGANQTLLSWEALEFEPDQNRNVILLGIGGALLIGAIFAFFFRTFLFGALLVISGGLVASYAFRKPRRLHLAITGRGIEIENRAYEFQDLKSFWIFYDPPLWKDLSLESKKTFMPFIKIPLGNQDPLPIREILLRFLPEAEHPETLTDIISKRLGF